MSDRQRRQSGLARQFDEMAREWREIAQMAAMKPNPQIRATAEARAECLDIAADMAEKWQLAGEAEESEVSR